VIYKQQGDPVTILLADDDTDDCFLFEKALNEISIPTKLIIVKNGEQLMDYLTVHTDHLPDILFLDLSMPRKNGFECLIEIKEDVKLEKLQVVIFSTSFTRGNDLEPYLINTFSKMGALDYIRKPSDFEQLKNIIHQVLIKLIATNGSMPNVKTNSK
jgi:CheY-like chemotaxis protein